MPVQEEKMCNYKMYDGKPCGRTLHDSEHCIFHSKYSEGKKAKFKDAFDNEFEIRKPHENLYDFSGFIFPYGYDLHGAALQGAIFKGAGLQRANLREAKLQEAYLRGANLQEARLQKADLMGAYLTKANLQGAYLRGANLQEAKLQGADLQGAKLTGAKFKGTTLARAKLQDAGLWKTNLQGAILLGADLRRANLWGAKLQGADLQMADLRRADLRSANLENCNVRGIKYNRFGRYQGIRLTNCYGSSLFERFAKDQDYIEEFRSSKLRKPLYWLWLILADCGRSLLLWASWALAMALLFAWKFFSMGPGAFDITNLKYSFETMVYYSIVTFTTLGFGDVIPNTVEASRWVMAEVIIGYIMLGGLISILANKLARRS